MEFKAPHGDKSLTISLSPDAAAGPAASGSTADPALQTVARPFRQRRRNRHGRGLRGPLLPASLPGARTRSEKFEDLVVDSADRLRSLWPTALAAVEYLVEEVPEQLEDLVASGAAAPWGRFTRAVPGIGHLPPKAPVIAIYRHPVEALCDTEGQLRELVHEAMVEQVAGLLNIDPDTVDPLFRRFRGH